MPWNCEFYDHAILPFTIEEVRVRRLGEPGAERGIDWLKLMKVGPAGAWDKGQILLQRGNRGLVAHSLDWQLREGRYELGLELAEVVGIDSAGQALLTLLVMSRGGRLRASRTVGVAELKQSRQVIAFEVRQDETPHGRLPVELHILSSGAVAVAVRSIIMRRIGDSTGTSVWFEQTKSRLDALANDWAGRKLACAWYCRSSRNRRLRRVRAILETRAWPLSDDRPSG